MIGYYNYTVIATYCSLICAILGTAFAVNGWMFASFVCLIICGGLDMVDGAIASTKKDRTPDEKSFGIQIDSLSDLVAFGVLPAVICFVFAREINSILAAVIAALYVLCGLIRLAYYNVSEQNRQGKESGKRVYYLGLPITMSALFFPLFYCFGTFVEGSMKYVALVFMVVIGTLFITPFKLKKANGPKMIFMVTVTLGALIAVIIKNLM